MLELLPLILPINMPSLVNEATPVYVAQASQTEENEQENIPNIFAL